MVSSIFLFLLLKTVSLSETIPIFDDLHVNCVIPSVETWIYFQYDSCLQLVINYDEYPSLCVRKLVDQLQENGITIYQKSTYYMETRNILKDTKTNCESFLMVMNKPQDWILEIINVNRKKRIFYPFTRLYFLSLLREENKFTKLTSYLYKNALFGYDFVFNEDNRIIGARDFFGSFFTKNKPIVADLSHPFLNTNDRNKNFTASVFNCFPNIIYLSENGTRYVSLWQNQVFAHGAAGND